ncbi:hypothetical protein LTR94_037166, partial [Friedmanniomyces endolithicus]
VRRILGRQRDPGQRAGQRAAQQRQPGAQRLHLHVRTLEDEEEQRQQEQRQHEAGGRGDEEGELPPLQPERRHRAGI